MEFTFKASPVQGCEERLFILLQGCLYVVLHLACRGSFLSVLHRAVNDGVDVAEPDVGQAKEQHFIVVRLRWRFLRVNPTIKRIIEDIIIINIYR
jgi:hypothetical protein